MTRDSIFERLAAAADAPLDHDPDAVSLLTRVVDALMRDDASAETRSALEYVAVHVIRSCWWAAEHDASLGLGGIYATPSALLAQFRREMVDAAAVREILRAPRSSSGGCK